MHAYCCFCGTVLTLDDADWTDAQCKTTCESESADPRYSSNDGTHKPAPNECVVVTAPAGWASYLVNNDDSGLDDREQEQADAWLKRENVRLLNPVGEQYFTNHIGIPEVSWTAGDALDFLAIPL